MDETVVMSNWASRAAISDSYRYLFDFNEETNLESIRITVGDKIVTVWRSGRVEIEPRDDR